MKKAILSISIIAACTGVYYFAKNTETQAHKQIQPIVEKTKPEKETFDYETKMEITEANGFVDGECDVAGSPCMMERVRKHRAAFEEHKRNNIRGDKERYQEYLKRKSEQEKIEQELALQQEKKETIPDFKFEIKDKKRFNEDNYEKFIKGMSEYTLFDFNDTIKDCKMKNCLFEEEAYKPFIVDAEQFIKLKGWFKNNPKDLKSFEFPYLKIIREGVYSREYDLITEKKSINWVNKKNNDIFSILTNDGTVLNFSKGKIKVTSDSDDNHVKNIIFINKDKALIMPYKD